MSTNASEIHTSTDAIEGGNSVFGLNIKRDAGDGLSDWLIAGDVGDVTCLQIFPTIRQSSGDTAYMFKSSTNLTASETLLKVQNGTVEAFKIGGDNAATNTGTFTSAGSGYFHSGTYYPSNTFGVASISAGMTNGAFWVGTLSNALQAVWMSNNVTLFKRLAP